MKTISNVIIIILIGLLSSTYLFNLSPIDYKGTIEIETPKDLSTLYLDADIDDELVNPDSIVIKHVSQKLEVVKSSSNTCFTADVYQGDNLILSNLNNLELISPSYDMAISISEDEPLLTTLNISQQNLGVEDGTYKIVLKSNIIPDDVKSVFHLDVKYDSSAVYYGALSTAPSNTKGLTLYFASENLETLIPITKFVVENKSITRMAIEQLQNGPLDSSLKTFINSVTNTTYNNGNVLIDLPSSYTKYNEPGNESQIAYQQFVKSIFAVKRYWPIHSLRFTVDRKTVDTYFNGIETKIPLKNTEENYILYMQYRIENRYYLAEHKIDTQSAGISDENSIENNALKMFDMYMDSNINYMKNPIPKNIILQNVSKNNSCLTLDFNNQFLKVYNNRDDLKLMMLESIIYSFTSIPGIDNIKITVDSSPLNNFIKDMDFSGALYAPTFINPEVVNIEK